LTGATATFHLERLVGDGLLEAGFARASGRTGPGPGRCIHLANCPFHELVVRHAGLVCAMNLHLLRGLTDELGGGAQARLDPAEGRCCVTITLP